MGNYNPRAPIILGNEWVPIRTENLELPTDAAPFEVGHRFTLTQSRTLDHACFYVDSFPGQVGATPQMIYIYPAGTEDDTGPVQSVIIPVNSGVITGADVSIGSASSVAEALANPDDGKSMRYLFNPAHSIPQYFTVGFPISQYAQQLNGKRILGVNLLYNGVATVAAAEVPNGTIFALMNSYPNFAGVQLGPLTDLPIYPTTSLFSPSNRVSKFKLGDYTELNTASFTAGVEGQVLPWRYADLLRLDRTASGTNSAGITIMFTFNTSGDLVQINYLALEVVYCTEQRVAVGGKYSGSGQGAPSGYNLGANIVQLFTPAGAVNPVLAAGDYTVVVTNGDTGTRNDGGSVSSVPPFNALRELYAIPSHPGFQIDRTTTLGEQFGLESTHVLPQLSIHVSGGGALTEPHVYGEQAGAPVYGSITASQVIYDDVVPTPASFAQVRFYARRFGDTTNPLVLSTTGPTISGSSVFISPHDLDLLPEIVDGWREVTLRFPTAPTMGGLTPDPSWTWSATGETAGNRWEVLLASAPALSGIPGNLLNNVPTVDQLQAATYQPTAGSATALTWLSPGVSGSTLDTTSDAVLIFSQDPPGITGVAVAVTSLALTGFSECSHGPCCVPTALQYNQVTWSTPLPIQADRFDRTVVNGLGGSWSITGTGGGTVNDFDVGGDTATVVTPGSHVALLPQSYTDFDDIWTFQLPALSAGAFTLLFIGRAQGFNDYYALRLTQGNSTGQLVARIIKTVAGAVSPLGSLPSLPFVYTGGERVSMRFQAVGTTLRGKIWLGDAADTQPDEWTVTVFNESTFTSGTSGFGYSASNASTLTVERFLAQPAGLYGSTIELQRQDFLTDWQTIMESDLADVLLFNDYEARVGVAANYRVRVCNGLDFHGQWSATVSATIPEPGVTLPSCGSGRRGVLLFTSNVGQSGQYALAYPPTWDSGTPVEDFSFPEGSDVTFTTQYGRDFSVAFHGSERGGESFQRTLLLANAAVALPRLAGAHSLRDLAWADLPYVCVRDELGDRWFAAVLVPGDKVKRVRRLYNADVTIVELTSTAAPATP